MGKQPLSFFSLKWPNIVVAEVNIQMTFKATMPAETRKRL